MNIRVLYSICLVVGLPIGIALGQSGSNLPAAESIGCPDTNRPVCENACSCAPSGPGGTAAPAPPTALKGSHSPILPPLASKLSAAGDLLQSGLDSIPSPKLSLLGEIDSVTGIPRIDRVDADYSSNGLFGLTFVRHYIGENGENSRNIYGETPLGIGWVHNYEMNLVNTNYDEYYPENPEIPGLKLPSGRTILFVATSVADVWRADPDYLSGLLVKTYSSDPEEVENDIYWYTLTVDGAAATYTFDKSGRLIALRDRNNNGLDLIYGSRYEGDTDPAPAGFLGRIQATAPDDRYLDLEYVLHNGQPRLHRVVPSWLSGSAEYTYTDYYNYNGALSTVKDGSGRLLEKYEYGADGHPAYLPNAPSFARWFTLYQPDASGQAQPVKTYAYGWQLFEGPILDRVYDGTGKITSQVKYGFLTEQAGGFGVFASSYHTNFPTRMDFYLNEVKQYELNQTFDSDPNLPTPANGSRRIKQVSIDSDVQLSVNYKSSTYNESDYDYTRVYSIAEKGKLPTVYDYTSLGRMKSAWTANDRFTSYKYDLKGNVVEVNRNGEEFTTYTLDALGRVFQKTTSLGTTSYFHDNRGHVRRIVDIEGQETCIDIDMYDRKTAAGSRGTTTTYAYDALDRLTTTTDALGNKTVLGYDWRDRVTTVTDPLGKSTVYEYSPTTGTLTSVTDAEGGVIQYEYDIYGKLIKLTDQRGYATTYTYDAQGRMLTEKDPLNHSTSYTYHPTGGCVSCGTAGNGTLASKTDPAGRTTYYEYDDGDQLTTVTYSGSSDTVVHSYDNYGRKVATFDNRLPVADFPTQTFTWTYDKFDRMLTETYPDGEHVSWTYDAAGRRTSLTDPDGNVTTYIKEWAGQENHDFIHNDISGDTHLYYSPQTGQLEIEQNYAVTPTVRFRFETSHSYDAIGRVSDSYYANANWNYDLIRLNFYNNDSTKESTHVAHVTGTSLIADAGLYYWYDRAKRLVWDSRESLSYPDNANAIDYDLAGNALRWWNTSPSGSSDFDISYNDNNQIQYLLNYWSNVNFDFSYDSNGNLTTKTLYAGATKVLLHDRENRLTLCDNNPSASDGKVKYVYDPSGRLLMRTANGNSVKYYYDGINNLLLKERPNGSTCWRRKRAYALKNANIGQVLATRDFNYPGSSCLSSSYVDTWYNYDELGNVVATVDDVGSMSRVEMDAWGTVHSGGYTGPRLMTKEYDLESGLYYFGARWYDPQLGRWLEKEPLGLDGPNMYNFTFQNPVFYTDYNGLQSRPPKPSSTFDYADCYFMCALFHEMDSEEHKQCVDGCMGGDGYSRRPPIVPIPPPMPPIPPLNFSPTVSRIGSGILKVGGACVSVLSFILEPGQLGAGTLPPNLQNPPCNPCGQH